MDNRSLQKTATELEELVKLNKETGRQTKWMMTLTIVIAILTLILAMPVVTDILAYVAKIK